jgi:hypothetical protein
MKSQHASAHRTDVGLTDVDFTAGHASSNTLELLLNLLLLCALNLSRPEAATTVQCRVEHLVNPGTAAYDGNVSRSTGAFSGTRGRAAAGR